MIHARKTAISVCVIAVPKPEPATPSPSGYMSVQLATAWKAAPAQRAAGCQDHEPADQAGRGGAQVCQGVWQGGGVGPQPGEQGRSEEGQEDRGDDAEPASEPHGLDPGTQREVASACPEVASRQRGSRVGQEDEQTNRRV